MSQPARGPELRQHVEKLFRDHAGFVASFLARLGIPAADVDDGVQEVFTVAYRKGGFAPGAASVRSWLGAIAVRVASTQRRTVRRRREVLADPTEGAMGASPHSATAPPPASAQAQLEQREALGRVERALEQLELPHRAVFVLFELHGEDCGAIAEALEVPVGTVYSRLHAARKKFLRAHTELLAVEAQDPHLERPVAPRLGDRP